MKPYVPLGLLYISAFLEENKIENELFDSTFSSFDAQKKLLQDTRPDVIAIYVNLMTKLNVIKLIKFIKTEALLKHTKIVLGGPELRHNADNFLKTGADYLVIGEGEQTMLELILALKNNLDVNSINGLAFLDAENKSFFTPERTLIKDINALPFPNRKKIDFTQYLSTWKKHHNLSMMSVSTMRGCPYTCKWCSRAVYGGTYRRRKPELVVEELKLIKANYNPDMIWFVDDVFTISHKWLKEFAEKVIEQNAVIPYEIISRADRLNEEVIALLKQSGCYRVWVGAESGSQKIIDAMDRRVDVIDTQEKIKLAKKYGIQAGTFIMLGYPGENKNDIKETIQHLINANPDFYTTTITYPIKGTELFNEIETKITTNYNFETNTDRDINFKRTYPRKYYEQALKWLQIEVYKHTKKINIRQKISLTLKSFYYQGKMEFAKWEKN